MEPTSQEKPRAFSRLGFFVALIGLVLIIGGFIFFESPTFELKNIQFQGKIGLAKEELMERMRLNQRISLFQLDMREMESILLEIPNIRTAKLERRLPNTLIVKVVERNPYCIVARNNGLWVMSDDGVILERTQAGKNPRLPILVGLQNAPVQKGNLDRIQDTMFRRGVALLKLAGEDLQDELVELDIKKNRLYTSDGIKVEFGDDRRSAEKMASLRALLSGSERQRIGSIDLRIPEQPIISGRTQ